MANNFFEQRNNVSTLSKFFPVSTLLFLPDFVFAQAPSTFREFAELIIAIVKSGVILLFVALGVGLAYGVVTYLAHAEDAKMRETIRSYLLWGVIGIIVVFGLWGILAILSATFGWGAVGIPIISPPEP